MSERKFDYNNVGTVYNQMKNINDNIKTLLTDTDNEVHNKVDVCDEAIFGDLGNQLLLSWDNISSNFPNFMDNFENWSALVAKASGDYSQFEADVAAFKNANPLGVTSGGAQYGAVATSSYNDSLTYEEIEMLDAATYFYEETGATYIDTGMVKYAKTHKTLNIVTDAIEIISWIPIVGAAGKAVGGAVKGGAKLVATGAKKVATKATSKAVAKVAAKKFAGEAAEKMAKKGVTKAGQKAATKAMSKMGREVAEEAIEQAAKTSGKRLTKEAMEQVAEDAIKKSSKKLGHSASKAIAQEASEAATKTAARQAAKTTVGAKIKTVGNVFKHPVASAKAAGAKIVSGAKALPGTVKNGVKSIGKGAKTAGSRIVSGAKAIPGTVSNGVKSVGAGVKTGYTTVKNGVTKAGKAAYSYASSADNIVFKNFNPVLRGAGSTATTDALTKGGKFAMGTNIVDIGTDLVTDSQYYDATKYSNQ